MEYTEIIQLLHVSPDSKVYGANMGPIWGLQDPDGPHVGPMNFAIWEASSWSISRNRKHIMFLIIFLIKIIKGHMRLIRSTMCEIK